MRATVAGAFVALLALAASVARAQAGTLSGTVSRDTLGSAIQRAEVQLPQLNRTTLTNDRGAFQFDNLPPGRYAIAVRAVGFDVLLDSVDVGRGANADADIVLTPAAVSLPSQYTTAATTKRLPPGLDEMQDRMKTHLGGYYVTDSTLRANDERKLTYFLGSVPALHQILTGTAVYLANALKPRARPCYIDIYVDGALFYSSARQPTDPKVRSAPPDFSTLTAFDYSGIEYYPTASGVPAEYNGTGSGCGVLLLWTRRTP